MARKKPAPKKPTSKKKSTAKKPIAKRKPAAKKKAAPKKKAVPKKKATAKKAVAKKPVAKRTNAKAASVKRPAAKKKAPAKTKAALSGSRATGQSRPEPISFSNQRGLGPESGGQSGDTQGLSRRESVDSESVEELLEEGQYLEAAAVSGAEDAPDADESELHTREVLEDDVPEEYTDRDE
jgi:outer membrane biosynthesis protein TonB